MAGISVPHTSMRRPMQVRFFREKNLSSLEEALNRWLAERPDREIVEARQSVLAEPGGRGGEGDVVVSVWFIAD